MQDLPLLTASVFHTVDSVLLESVVQCINKEKSMAGSDRSLTFDEVFVMTYWKSYKITEVLSEAILL